MNSDAIALFRELVDRSPAEREEYYVRQRVAPELRAEVESLLRFDGDTAGTIHTQIAAAAEAALAERPTREPERDERSHHPTPLTAGTRLGPYVLDSLIGTGGMGEVYRAHDSRLNRTVAIKVLAAGIATPERVRRFEREARAASALNHPNILTIYDVGRDRDAKYFAMEWVDGQTLRQLMLSGTVSLRQTLQIAQQITDGLAKAHASGIVHRDLKPENVMMTSDGLTKIVDFGIAKLGAPAVAVAVSDGDPTVAGRFGTASGAVMGTVGYMSPEQAGGRPVDHRSDQFSLGLMIYELITRTRPFERPTTAETLAATIECEPTPIEALCPEVPPALASVVARCLAKNPAERYESTRDLAHDLKAIGDSPSRSSGLPAASTSVARKRLLAGAAVLLVAVLAAASSLWRGAREAPAEQGRPFVAIRSFRSLSPDPAQGYFAAGITEEIRGQLSQVSSLRLLSRAALEGVSDADAVARGLGVTGFVDGSVRVDGNRVRVTAELIDATTQETLWSNHYDRDLADVLEVQSDVALQIAGALHATLSADERQRLERRPTGNPQAYDLYLQAQRLPTGDRVQNLAAIELLRTSLGLDPAFALARSRLAYRLVFMAYYDDPSYVRKGIAEAEAVLQRDPSQANAHLALATGYAMQGMLARARQAFLRALEVDTNHVTAMYNLSALVDAAVGRFDDSLYWARRGFELSGRQANDHYHVGLTLINLREDELARRFLVEAERRYPAFHRIQSTLAILEWEMGQASEAVARTAALHARQPQNEEVKFLRADIAYLTGSDDLKPALEALMEKAASNALHVAESVRLRYAFVLGRNGDAGARALVDEAERIARDKVAQGDESPALRLELAAAAVLGGREAEALEWVSRAYDAGYRDHALLEGDPILASLRDKMPFRDILERMRQDVAAQRRRARDRDLLEIDALLARG
jgi:TolB-like protein/Tfp pilus assembly protein PilF